MGAMKPDQHFSKKLNLRLRSIKIEQYFGKSQFGNQIQSTTVEANIGLTSKSTFQIKMPYTKSEHSGWFLEGLGDISMSLTKNIVAKEKYQINATIGAKIPTGDGNGKIASGQTLPMYYQPSLGTYDVVLGLSYITDKWLIATGYQKALNANNSHFAHREWEGHKRYKEILQYPDSYKLQRGSDVMFRIERNFRFSRLSFNSGLLFIHRFNKDRITNPKTNEVYDAPGSNGLVINLILGTQYRLSAKSSFQLLYGYKIINREFNPDGLSRGEVIIFGYQYNF